jgi:hypothetical protein
MRITRGVRRCVLSWWPRPGTYLRRDNAQRRVYTVLRTGSDVDTSPPAGFCGQADDAGASTRGSTVTWRNDGCPRLVGSSFRLPEGSR